MLPLWIKYQCHALIPSLKESTRGLSFLPLKYSCITYASVLLLCTEVLPDVTIHLTRACLRNEMHTRFAGEAARHCERRRRPSGVREAPQWSEGGAPMKWERCPRGVREAPQWSEGSAPLKWGRLPSGVREAPQWSEGDAPVEWGRTVGIGLSVDDKEVEQGCTHGNEETGRRKVSVKP